MTLVMKAVVFGEREGAVTSSRSSTAVVGADMSG